MSRTRIVGGKITKIVGEDFKIFSKGNITFNSNDEVVFNGKKNGVSHSNPKQPPVASVKQIIKDCIVHFRPKSNWNGNGYGFDWVRVHDTTMPGDIAQKDNTGKYGAIYGSQPNAVFTKDSNLYKKLMRTFDPYNLILKDKNGKDKPFLYCVPIVSLYPKTITKTVGGKSSEVNSNYKNTTATLKMIIAIGKKPEKIELQYDKKFFDIKHNQIPLSIGNHKLDVTITCLKEFDKNQSVKVISVYKNTQGKLEEHLSGKLNVLRNKQRYKANVLFVKVITNINNSKNPNIPKIVGRSTELKKYLNQALINPKTETVSLDLSTDNNVITKKKDNRKTNFNAIVHPVITPKRNYIPDGSLSTIYQFLNNELYKQYDQKKYKDYYKIYFINEDANGLYGIGRSIDKKDDYRTIIVYKDGFTDSTLAHETLHSMGLYHTFDNNGEFTFKFCQTDNIMDYSDAYTPKKDVISTYHWQWAKLWSRVTKE